MNTVNSKEKLQRVQYTDNDQHQQTEDLIGYLEASTLMALEALKNACPSHYIVQQWQAGVRFTSRRMSFGVAYHTAKQHVDGPEATVRDGRNVWSLRHPYDPRRGPLTTQTTTVFPDYESALMERNMQLDMIVERLILGRI